MPHITLLAGLHGSEKELVIKVSGLAKKMKAFSVKTNAIETQDSFYKSLYLKIVETEPLSENRQQAEALFHPKQEDDFMPHLSLLYGNQSEQDKQIIMANLRNKTRLELLIDRVALILAVGPPEEWIIVSTEQLH